MSTQQRERRLQRRRKEQVALVFHFAQERCEASTLNVSRGGALIRAPVSFPSGTLLILECPNLCSTVPSVRLLARVVRASQGGGIWGADITGLGLLWVRAYSAGGPEVLSEFLVDKLGFETEAVKSISQAQTGDAVFDFPSVQPSQPEVRPSESQAEFLSMHKAKQQRLESVQRGRFRLEVPVVYSIHNMHYRGTLVALDKDGLTVATEGALPFLYSTVSVRYPLDRSLTAPRVLLEGETEVLVEPAEDEPGYFSARIQSIEEYSNRGIFRMHLRKLNAGESRW